MDVDVVDHLRDVGVEQGVHGKRGGLDLRAGQALELVGTGGVHDGDLDAAALLVGLEHGVVRGELREAVSPLDAVAKRRAHGGIVDVVGKLGGAGTADDAAGDLRDDDGGQKDGHDDDGGARHRLADVGAGGVLAGEWVDVHAGLLAAAAGALLARLGCVRVARLVHVCKEGLYLVERQLGLLVLLRHLFFFRVP